MSEITGTKYTLCTIGNRNYYAWNNGQKVYKGIITGSGGQWTGPLLVSKDKNSVTYTTSIDSTIFTSNATIVFGNETYYCSNSEYFMADGSTVSSTDTLKKYNAQSVTEAAFQLLADSLGLANNVVRFGKDGTLYCNTVKYNYKQARNMIADGSYGNLGESNVWKNDVVESIKPAGYKSYRCFKVDANKNIQQSLPTFINGHKYYFSFRYNALGNTLNASVKIQTSTSQDLATASLQTNPNAWVLNSQVFTVSGNQTGGKLVVNASSNTLYICRFILLDLTDTFGSGNEPSKEWCDNNIREQEVYINFGSCSSIVKSSNRKTIFYPEQISNNWQDACFDYLSVDSNWEPRDYFYYIQGDSNYEEALLYSQSNGTLNNELIYYMYWDEHLEQNGTSQSCDFYFPIAEPKLGNVDLVDELQFNGGGGMRDWKRASCFNDRSSFSNTTTKIRFDFNNCKQTNVLRVTSLNLMSVASTVAQYKAYNKVSVSNQDINKEWCDRWIDGRSNPILHIKDPNNTQISFSVPYTEAVRGSTATFSKQQAESLQYLENNAWDGITNASNLKPGQKVYINFIRSDDSKPCRFLLQVNSIDGNTVYAKGLGYGDTGTELYHRVEGCDVICNDVEIRPELNKVIMDETGTIKCKKLVKNQLY